MEPLDAVRAIVRDVLLGCVDVEGSGAGVRGADSTDLLLILFFEVDTGIMEVNVPGSRDFPGVWNACTVDLGLVGEEGLDFACELAVGKAKPIDLRGFGVSGVDEDAEKMKLWYQASAQRLRSSKQYSYLRPYRPSHPPSSSRHQLPSVWLQGLLSPPLSPSMHQPVWSLQLTIG